MCSARYLSHLAYILPSKSGFSKAQLELGVPGVPHDFSCALV